MRTERRWLGLAASIAVLALLIVGIVAGALRRRRQVVELNGQVWRIRRQLDRIARDRIAAHPGAPDRVLGGPGRQNVLR